MVFTKDIKTKTKNFAPKVIFDIGANKGQSAVEYAAEFPSAKIFAFEPAKATFDILAKAVAGNENVSLHQVALDLSNGVVQFTNFAGSTGNRIVRTPGKEDPQHVENVETVTGDHFCAANGVDHIDILKIDTEGNDLRVLAGFTGMLSEKKVQFVQVECGTNLDNRFHVHLERFIHFLHPFNYRLYNLYEVHRTVFKTKQKLNGIWFCNAVFVLEVDNPSLRRDGSN